MSQLTATGVQRNRDWTRHLAERAIAEYEGEAAVLRDLAAREAEKAFVLEREAACLRSTISESRRSEEAA